MKKILVSTFFTLFAIIMAFGQNNSVLKEGPKQSLEYIAPQMNPQACPSILLFTDDNIHDPDYPEVALQNLGYSYTGYYGSDFAGFETALTSGNWDIVIFANENSTPPSSLFAALLTYVQAGGKLIYNSWIQDVPLETAMGVVTLSSYLFPPTIPVYRWNTGHPLFNLPNAVPDLTALTSGNHVFVDGWYTDPIAPAIGLAGYTNSPSANQCGFVVGNSGNTIYQGWLNSNVGDADTDSKNDQVELYENMLTFFCPPEPVVPVSDWAVVVGMILITLALTFRFIRR